MAAVADRSVSSPPAGAAAPLVLRSRLALAAADAVMCVCFASAWLLFAGADAFAIGHAIWGDDSPVLDAALLVILAAAASLTISFFSVLALSTCIADSSTKEDKAPATPRSSAAATREALSKTDILGSFGTMAFVVLMLVGGLVKEFGPVKGSRRETIGSAIMDVGLSGESSLCCLIVIPTLALRIWRMRRSGWRWCDSCERKPSRGQSAVSVKIGKELQVLTLC